MQSQIELPSSNNPRSLVENITRLVNQSTSQNNRLVHSLFMKLMILQYFAGIAIALWITPQTWVAETPYLHHHVWVAIFFGGFISGLPLYFARVFPDAVVTKHIMAVAQAAWSALLIHLTGGRLETHFHVFGTLAFIAFYRDWKVILTMTFVVAMDHVLRGIWWPISVYGVATESSWRWAEHLLWVILEDTVLVFYCLRGKQEELTMCHRHAELEALNAEFEQNVTARTLEIENEKLNAERLAMVVKHTDNAVLILDIEGKTEWVNEAFTRSTGYVLDDIRGKRPYELLAGPATEPDALEAMIAGIESQNEFDLEITKHRKDGSPLVVEIEARPILNTNGDVIQFVHIERDITQKKQFETERSSLTRELQESTQHLAKLALVAQHTSNAVIITDAQGQAEWANEGFTRMTGFKPEEILGKRPGDFLQGSKTCQATLEKIQECLAKNLPFSGELIHYKKSGEPFWGYVQLYFARNEAGEVYRFIGVIADISERKAAEQERDSLNSKLNAAARIAGRADIATGVLHNVGNVLNSVNVSAMLLQEKLRRKSVDLLAKAAQMLGQHESDIAHFLTEDERGKPLPKFIQQVTDALVEERAAETQEVETLLEHIGHTRKIVLAQQSLAKRQRHFETFKIEDLIDSTLSLVDTSGSHCDAKIVKQLDPLPAIKSEQYELIQILANLINNALDACEFQKTRVITITAVEESGSARIDVTDTGVGIAPEQLPILFQHGFTTKEMGHGFGLHTGAIVATDLGGSLSASSPGLGKGATFTLRIPFKTQQ